MQVPCMRDDSRSKQNIKLPATFLHWYYIRTQTWKPVSNVKFAIAICILQQSKVIITVEGDHSREPGPQAKGVNHLETPLRQLHATDRASSCAERGGHVQLCSKPRGARRIKPESSRRRGQLLSHIWLCFTGDLVDSATSTTQPLATPTRNAPHPCQRCETSIVTDNQHR